MQPLALHATLEDLRSRKDKTYALRIGTQELQPDQVGDISRLLHQFCWCVLMPEGMDPSQLTAPPAVPEPDMPPTRPPAANSPSKRLRDAIYRLWQAKPDGAFEPFYERVIHHCIGLVGKQLETLRAKERHGSQAHEGTE